MLSPCTSKAMASSGTGKGTSTSASPSGGTCSCSGVISAPAPITPITLTILRCLRGPSPVSSQAAETLKARAYFGASLTGTGVCPFSCDAYVEGIQQNRKAADRADGKPARSRAWRKRSLLSVIQEICKTFFYSSPVYITNRLTVEEGHADRSRHRRCLRRPDRLRQGDRARRLDRQRDETQRFDSRPLLGGSGVCRPGARHRRGDARRLGAVACASARHACPASRPT